jgi:hypothetical protein
MRLSKYSANFYESVAERADLASQSILPIFFSKFHASSIKDIGCGNGIWLRETLNNQDIKNRYGYDLASALESAEHLINKDIIFKEIDLEANSYDLIKTDLTLCLEVAEHISMNAGLQLVKNICRTSSYVIFSAATPGQGGYNHINEKPFEYWVSLFESNGFVGLDVFRNEIQKDKKIPFFYRNNVFLFVDSMELSKVQHLLTIDFIKQTKISAQTQIKDYRTFVQIFIALIISRLHFKVVNFLSIMNYHINSIKMNFKTFVQK